MSDRVSVPLALVGDRTRFDGFDCFPCSDVKNLRQDLYAAPMRSGRARLGSAWQLLEQRASVRDTCDTRVSGQRAYVKLQLPGG